MIDIILIQRGDAWPWAGDVVRSNSKCYRLTQVGMPHEGSPLVFEGRRWGLAQGVPVLNYDGVVFDAGCYVPQERT